MRREKHGPDVVATSGPAIDRTNRAYALKRPWSGWTFFSERNGLV